MNQILDKLNQQHNIIIDYELKIDQQQLQNSKTKFQYSTVTVITDSNLELLHLEALIQQLTSLAPRLLTFVVSPGEVSKCRETKAEIEDFLLEHQCDRESVLVALGGGVIGDLVGFVASTYLRGISLIHVPTTLLAMVDSSIGGKNGIDTKHGKNLIGTYWEPKRNCINLSFLQSLPPREFFNGMAEIIKMAAISSKEEFELLEADGGDDIRPGHVNSEKLLRAVTSAIQFKVNVVSQDCKDAGLRQLLNYGHTIGHGIEALLSPRFLHGECVSIGMILETKIAIALGHCTASVLGRLEAVLKQYKLPVSLANTLLELADENDIPSIEQIIKIIGVDKKNSGGSVRIVLLSGIGSTYEPSASPIATELIEKLLYEEFMTFTLKYLAMSFGNSLATRNIDRIPPVSKNPSFFLCLTLPDLTPIATDLPKLAKGADAIELRIDQLKAPDGFKFTSKKMFLEFLNYVAKQVAILKKHMPDLPIIYTPRTCAEGGRIPDDTPGHVMLAMYMLGIHLGCELIDVQMSMPQNLIKTLLDNKNAGTRIIASYHQLNNPLKWSGSEAEKYLKLGQSFGNIVKIVSIAHSESDNQDLEEFSRAYWETSTVSSTIPLIAINARASGQKTRVANRYLTPVTHTDLSNEGIGQLTVEQILEARGLQK